MSAISAITSAIESGASNSFGSNSDIANSIQSLAASSGVDSGKLDNLVKNLQAAVASGDKTSINNATNALLSELAGGNKSGGSSGNSGTSSSSNDSGQGSDTLAQLGKLLESLGLSKDQIDKIVNKAQEAGVGGATFNADSSTGNSVGGVQTA